MTVGLSLVGFQPSATAVALKTWIQVHGRLNRVFLLATARILKDGQAKRLEALCARWGCPADILAIGDTLESDQSPPSALEVVRQVVNKVGQGSRAVFCGDPGPKFLVASLAQVLPSDARFLHADTEHLHCGTVEGGEERWERYDLQDLGMTDLLTLYGLEGEASPGQVSPSLKACLARYRIELPPRVYQGFTLRGLDAPPLDLAYERGGWLFGLCWVNTLEQMRAVAARMSHLPHGLRPVLAMVAEKPTLRTHIRAARLHAISPAVGSALRDWIQGKIPPPGHELIPDAVELSRPLRPCRGRGGSGPPLVVWIGADPSATLVSLCTHRPQRAWVLYDSQTPLTIEMVRRLRECCQRLPVGDITFWASDLLGRRLVPALSQQLRLTQAVRADITPGRKAQGIALARLSRVQLWSLRTSRGDAVPLLGGTASLPLQGPNLATQARMSGGRLARPGDDACAWDRGFRDFLMLLGRFLAAKVAEPPGRIFLDPLVTMACSRGQVEVQGNRIDVAYDGQRKQHELNPQGGYWFEKVVASAFVAAGADDVRVGVRWAWPPGSLPPTEHRLAAFREDADVVARFGHRFFVVSCKVGSKPTLAAAAREYEAKALRCVGRLAVPLVIRPRIDRARIEERWKIRQGAAYLDLASLCEPDQLRRTLHELWSARSTLGE